MTRVEELALAVQASVLDRLALQLAAIEGAIVRVEALSEVREFEASEGSSGPGSHERAQVARDEGERGREPDGDPSEEWTTVFEAGEPTPLDERVEPTARGPARDPDDRWSAPIQPRRHEAMPAREPKRAPSSERASEQAEPKPSAGSGTRHVGRSEAASAAMLGRTREPAVVASESLVEQANELETDRWSRPLRLFGATARVADPVLGRPSATSGDTSSIATRRAPSERPPAIDRSERLDPRPRDAIDLPMPDAIEPSEPLRLPAPLRLADEPVFDRLRSFTGSPSLPRSAADTRMRTELAEAAIREPSLDDEFDELARLEERIADVLERVLIEIGVEP